MAKKKDKRVDFNKSLKNFKSRMKKFSYVKGATYSHKFYELESEIESYIDNIFYSYFFFNFNKSNN